MNLNDLIEQPTPRKPIVTILGDSGLGKTTLACAFPNAVIMRAEDGLEGVPKEIMPKALPVIKKVDDVWTQLELLCKSDHDFETLIIDSCTELETLFIDHVISTDSKNPNSINQALGGYGNGTGAVASLHHRVRKFCGYLNEKRNMSIVFIAHADTESIEPPDGEGFTRYTLRLGKKSISPYVDKSDVVGFIKLKTFIKNDTNKAISTGERALTCYATAANVSKNRYGIDQDIPVEILKNPLEPYIPALNKKGK